MEKLLAQIWLLKIKSSVMEKLMAQIWLVEIESGQTIATPGANIKADQQHACYLACLWEPRPRRTSFQGAQKDEYYFGLSSREISSPAECGPPVV